jgi:Resolvase, N terminal domain
MLTILGAVAEFERQQIAERVKEGMASGKQKGARPGRPSSEATSATGQLHADCASEWQHSTSWWVFGKERSCDQPSSISANHA